MRWGQNPEKLDQKPPTNLTHNCIALAGSPGAAKPDSRQADYCSTRSCRQKPSATLIAKSGPLSFDPKQPPHPGDLCTGRVFAGHYGIGGGTFETRTKNVVLPRKGLHHPEEASDLAYLRDQHLENRS